MSTKLIKCKSCEKEISVEAKSCPHCGAPNKKKLGCLSLFGISIGGVIVILILVSLFDGGSGTSNSGSNAPASPVASPTRTPTPTSLGLNQPVRAGHMEWVITGVRTGRDFKSEFAEVHTDSDETMLVFVSGKVTNRSDREDTTLGGNLYLVDEKGMKYGEKKEGLMVAEPLVLDSFNPNVPKKFSTIFEIPKTARGLKFQATDFSTFSQETALIDLGLGSK